MPDVVDFAGSKRSATKIRVALDFLAVMEAGDTVASAAVTATDAAGADVSASLISGVSFSGTKALWTYKAWGTVDAVYYVRVTATTTGGDIIPRVIKLTIRGL